MPDVILESVPVPKPQARFLTIVSYDQILLVLETCHLELICKTTCQLIQ